MLGRFCPGERSSTPETWHHAGYVAEMVVWDIANRVKDRHDETVDAMRFHNGMTLDEFLAKK